MRVLKRILKAPKAAPNAIVLFELGVLPIEHEIYKKKLMFLHHILKLELNDPVRKVYEEQLKYDAESNWSNEVMRIRGKINTNVSDKVISDLSKEQWKSIVDKSIKKAAVSELNSESQRLKKVNRQYNDLKLKQYLHHLSLEDARIAFGYRSGTLNIKCHKQYLYDDTTCRACGNPQENIEHIVNECCAVQRNHTMTIDIDSEDVNTISEIVQSIKTFLNKVSEDKD